MQGSATHGIVVCLRTMPYLVLHIHVQDLIMYQNSLSCISSSFIMQFGNTVDGKRVDFAEGKFNPTRRYLAYTTKVPSPLRVSHTCTREKHVLFLCLHAFFFFCPLSPWMSLIPAFLSIIFLLAFPLSLPLSHSRVLKQ